MLWKLQNVSCFSSSCPFYRELQDVIKTRKKRSKPNVVSTPANHILGPQKLKTFVDSGPAW